MRWLATLTLVSLALAGCGLGNSADSPDQPGDPTPQATATGGPNADQTPPLSSPVATIPIEPTPSPSSGPLAATPLDATTSPTPLPSGGLETPPADIVPVRFPEDEAPHNHITEWWYYTGHLFTPEGDRYGFEYVFFKVQLGSIPTGYAGHFAITDNVGGRFVYEQRTGPDGSTPAEGFDLRIGEWEMRGALGADELKAAMDGYAIDLMLTAEKEPTLHNDVGYVQMGPSGGSYYYSRTRMGISGTLTVDGAPVEVTGEAWMDHQWGNFLAVGPGWDWFSVQLDNGEELMLSLVRDAAFNIGIAYGTLTRADGSVIHLPADAFTVAATGEWTSPHSGVTYPLGWTIGLLEQEWVIELVPTMEDQELDTRASTATIYWEGEVEVSGTVAGESVTGLGYVELTGYTEQD